MAAQTYRSNFGVRYNNPDKLPSSDAVSKIFLKTNRGKYFDIKRAIMEEKTTLNLQDISKRSILHYILLNSDLGKNDKYELIKYVLELGAPVDLADMDGVRPLHLASSQQNRNTIKLLLEKGAEPNSTDNNYMTPLHYAVMPEHVKCKSTNRNNNDDNDLISYNKNTTNFRTDPLLDQLFRLFQSDKTVLMYFKHIANLFNNRFIYDNQSEDRNNYNTKITYDLIKKNKKSTDENLNDLNLDFKKSLFEVIKIKLTLPLSKIDIKENIPDSWGPISKKNIEQKLSFLPVKNLNSEMNNFYKLIMISKDKVIMNLNKYIINADKKLDELNKYLEIITTTINILYSQYVFTYMFKNELVLNEIDKDIFLNLENFLNLFINERGAKTYPDFFKDKNNFAGVNVQKNEYPLLNRFSHKVNNKTTLLDELIHHINAFIRIKNITVQKINDIINTINANIEDFQWDIITNLSEIQLLIINMAYILIIINICMDNINDHIQSFLTSYEDEKTNYDIYFNFVFNILNNILENNNNIISSFVTLGDFNRADSSFIPREFNLIYFNDIDNNIELYSYNLKKNDNTLNILTINNYPTSDHYDNYVVNEKLNKNIGRVNKNFEVGIEDPKKINDTLKYLSSSKEIISNIYNNNIELQKQINIFIDCHNLINGFLFTYHFNNDMNNNTYNKTKTNKMDHLLLTKMKHMKLLPESYDNFRDNIQPLIKTNDNKSLHEFQPVKSLIENYGYSLNDNIVDQLIVLNNDPDSFVQKQTNGIFPGEVFDDNDSIIINNIIIIGNPANTISIIPGNPDSSFNKDAHIPPEITIINSIVDLHLYMIKLIIIMYFTQKIINIYDNSDSLVDNEEKKMYNILDDMIIDIEKLSSSANSLAILIAIIGKMIDDIVIKSIENMVKSSIGNYINYLSSGKDNNDNLYLQKNENVKQLIIKPVDKIERDFNILLSVVSSSIINEQHLYDNMNMNILQFFGKQFDTEDYSEQNRLIDFESIDTNNDICYDVNEDAISELLKAGADANAPDRTGETPLSFACYLQNENIVQILLRSGAIVISKKKNIYESSFDNLLNSIDSSPGLNLDEINQRLGDTLINITKTKKIFNNSKLIIGMCNYLFNHQITSNISTYPNMWTREQHSQILSLLTLNRVDRDLIPLAKIDPLILKENIQGYVTYNDTLDAYNKKLIYERDILVRLTHSVNEMTAELKTLPKDSSNEYHREELTGLLSEIQIQRDKVAINIELIIKKIKELLDAKSNADNTMLSDTIKKEINKNNIMQKLITANKTSRDICNIYDIFFTDIISTGNNVLTNEYITYLKMWKKLLTRPERDYVKDYTQMINILQIYILNQGILDPVIFLDTYSPIFSLYEKVLSKYGRDFLELSDFLDENGTTDYMYNYVLKQIYCIMIHVFSHTMSVDFINSVAQTLAKQIHGTESSLVQNVYLVLKTSGFIEHCIVNVPKQVIKVVCKISGGEKDLSKTQTVNDILNHALDILTLSTYQGVDKNTIEDVTNIIVPFFVTYMETYTKEMYSSIIKQIKLFIVQNRWLQIVKLLAEKTITEKISFTSPQV